MGVPPLEHAVLIVPLKAAGAAAGKKKKKQKQKKKTFVLQVQEIVPLFPMCKRKSYKVLWSFLASPSICFSPVNSWRGTGGVPPLLCPPRACLGAQPSHLPGEI